MTWYLIQFPTIYFEENLKRKLCFKLPCLRDIFHLSISKHQERKVNTGCQPESQTNERTNERYLLLRRLQQKASMQVQCIFNKFHAQQSTYYFGRSCWPSCEAKLLHPVLLGSRGQFTSPGAGVQLFAHERRPVHSRVLSKFSHIERQARSWPTFVLRSARAAPREKLWKSSRQVSTLVRSSFDCSRKLNKTFPHLERVGNIWISSQQTALNFNIKPSIRWAEFSGKKRHFRWTKHASQYQTDIPIEKTHFPFIDWLPPSDCWTVINIIIIITLPVVACLLSEQRTQFQEGQSGSTCFTYPVRLIHNRQSVEPGKKAG